MKFLRRGDEIVNVLGREETRMVCGTLGGKFYILPTDPDPVRLADDLRWLGDVRVIQHSSFGGCEITKEQIETFCTRYLGEK